MYIYNIEKLFLENASFFLLICGDSLIFLLFLRCYVCLDAIDSDWFHFWHVFIKIEQPKTKKKGAFFKEELHQTLSD